MATTYKHGIYGREVPTKVVPPIISTVGLPVVVGTAPIHTAKNPAEASKPYLIYTFEEAVEKFGYSDDWDKYTLSEVIYSQFVLYGRAPIVLINVLDLSKNKKDGQTEKVRLQKGKAVLKNKNIIPATIKLTVDSVDSLTLGEDYQITVGATGEFILTSLSKKLGDVDVTVNYSEVDISKITSKEIIGGIDTHGKRTGLELVSEVFPKFRLQPGFILAPGYSHLPEVAAVMNTKARKVNNLWGAIALIDAPTNIDYTQVAEWKNTNNIVQEGQIVLYPALKLGDKKYHYSTHFVGSVNVTDGKYGGIPYKSPSNENLKIDSTVTDSGEIIFDLDQANLLNGQGIVTALNFNGWKTWGNRTAVYPTSSDVKDTFISNRRMFDWTMNTVILTYFSKVDEPINKRLIETVVNSMNIWLNGLSSQGVLIGGKVEFLASENPVTDVMDGKVRFHFYITPPSPARDIEFIQEYDVNLIQNFINGIVE